MAGKKDLLMIALGKKKPAPPTDEPDDGMDYGADDESDKPDDSDEEDDKEPAEDDDSIGCAHDLMDALDKGDAEGIVEAIRAIAESK